MAHAGTPADLAQKPAASTNGLWQPVLAVIVILAIGVGMVLIASNVAAPRSVAAPAVDHRLDRIESQRGATTISAADGSYTQVESNRGGALTVSNQVRGGPFTAASQAALQGTAPDAKPVRILGHRRAMIDQ